MAEIDALGVVDEIQSFVSDKLQVVSYKWLSRNYMVSSNVAKRLLEAFVDKYGDGIEVIYCLSGWLKQSSPPSYHIRLVSENRLSEAKQDFDGNCSIHIYSVQACLPKDPATLWNHEFVQAEELFRQPLLADNCLLDNRFGGVTNTYVKRSADAEKIQVKTPAVPGPSRNLSVRPTTPTLQPKQNSSPNTRVQSVDAAKAVKIEGQLVQDQDKVGDKENIPKLCNNNKKVQSSKGSSAAGTALAGMWGRASTKRKTDAASEKSDHSKQSSAEAQISAREAVELGSSDDDGQDFHVKRTSNGEGSKKRKVVFDYSDEEDEFQDAINLDSPDPPKKSVQYMKDSSNSKGLEHNLSFEKESDPKVNQLQEADEKDNKPTAEKRSEKSKHDSTEQSDSAKKPNHEPEMNASIKHEVVDAQPKRRKVVKTRIDERGREVSEVVWEGEEENTKSVANTANTSEKSEKSTTNNAVNRPAVVKKSPAVGNTAPSNKPGKAGNKKAGANKDPKQGNILSFFKKA